MNHALWGLVNIFCKGSEYFGFGGCRLCCILAFVLGAFLIFVVLGLVSLAPDLSMRKNHSELEEVFTKTGPQGLCS